MQMCDECNRLYGVVVVSKTKPYYYSRYYVDHCGCKSHFITDVFTWKDLDNGHNYFTNNYGTGTEKRIGTSPRSRSKGVEHVYVFNRTGRARP